MSKIQPGTLYYGMLERNLVQIVTEKNNPNFFKIKTLSNIEMVCRITKEKFSLLGHCKIVAYAVADRELEHKLNIVICPMNEWESNHACFEAGRNGPLDAPRTI